MTDPMPTVSKKEAEKRAKGIVSKLINEADNDRNKNPSSNSAPGEEVLVKPTWIQYYESKMSRRDTNYGKGAAREFGYFELSLMKKYVDQNSRFLDLVAGPEPQGLCNPLPGHIRSNSDSYYLTVAEYGNTIAVCVTSLGSVGEVKSINISTFFIDRMSLGVINQTIIVLQVEIIRGN